MQYPYTSTIMIPHILDIIAVFGMLVLLLQKLHSLCHMYNSDNIAMPFKTQAVTELILTRGISNSYSCIIIPLGTKFTWNLILQFYVLQLVAEQ